MELVKNKGVAVCYFSYVKREKVPQLHSSDRPTPVLDLTFCIEGEMHYNLNGESIILHSGDAILIPPGSIRERFETDIPTRYASVNLIFDHEIKPEMTGFLPACIDSNVLYLLDLFKKDFATVSERKNEKCLATFSYIYNYILENVCSTENPHVTAIKQYIFDNLSGDLSLEKIACHVHLAPQYICTLFKKQTDITITKFILEARIDLAKMLIVSTADPIFEIAESCGFTDYCYFSHTFKKLTGISAAGYRKAKRK